MSKPDTIPTAALYELRDSSSLLLATGSADTAELGWDGTADVRFDVPELPLRDGRVDEVATERLRRDMLQRRGPTQLFDRGFKSIDELRSRCKAETGFEPPREPRFLSDYKMAAE